jgi:hypothetical protein
MQPCITKKTSATDARPPRFRQVEDHRSVWINVLPGLQALLAQDDDPDWSIEGIDEMLRNGEATLLVDCDDETAFAVVKVTTYMNDLALLIYAMWHQCGNAVEKFHPHLEFMARAAGIRYVRFYSQRMGMARLVSRFGYRVRSIEYLKELQP